MAHPFDDLSIVVDIGSSNLRIGLGGEDEPKHTIPSIVLQSLTNPNEISFDIKQHSMFPSFVIDQGIVSNWDHMKLLLEHAFYELMKIKDFRKQNILVTKPPLTDFSMSQKWSELLFEEFQFPKIYLEDQGILSLYAYGRTTGIVLDIGESNFCVSAIYEATKVGQDLKSKLRPGRSQTEVLMEYLSKQHKIFETVHGVMEAQKIKEKLSFKEQKEQTFTLLDGTSVTVGKDGYRCLETIFDPSIVGINEPGLKQMVEKCIDECPIDTKKYCNNRCICVAGGCSLQYGFRDRLEQNSEYKYSIIPERNIACWIGGSILVSLTSFQKYWITASDYAEYGSNIMRRNIINYF